jgi:hypothetical protein
MIASAHFQVVSQFADYSSFYGSTSEMSYSVVFKSSGTFVTLFDAKGENHFSFEFDAMMFLANDRTAARLFILCSAAVLRSRKQFKAVVDHMTIGYVDFAVNRIVYFSHAKQSAREIYNVLD